MKKLMISFLVLISLSAFAETDGVIPEFQGHWKTVDSLMGGSSVYVKYLSDDIYRVQVKSAHCKKVTLGLAKMTYTAEPTRGTCLNPVKQELSVKVPGRPDLANFILKRSICEGDYVEGDNNNVISLYYDTHNSSVGAKTKDAMSSYTLIKH